MGLSIPDHLNIHLKAVVWRCFTARTLRCADMYRALQTVSTPPRVLVLSEYHPVDDEVSEHSGHSADSSAALSHPLRSPMSAAERPKDRNTVQQVIALVLTFPPSPLLPSRLLSQSLFHSCFPLLLLLGLWLVPSCSFTHPCLLAFLHHLVYLLWVRPHISRTHGCCCLRAAG